jgi:hypothetical protein
MGWVTFWAIFSKSHLVTLAITTCIFSGVNLQLKQKGALSSFSFSKQLMRFVIKTGENIPNCH